MRLQQDRPAVDSDCESLGRLQPCALCSVGNGSTKGFPWRLEWESEGSVQELWAGAIQKGDIRVRRPGTSL